MTNDEKKNKAANNILYFFMLIGVVPLIIIFGIYLHNPESQLLNNIAARTGSLPAVISSNSPLMTKVMDVYCKSAPLLALILFIFLMKKPRVIKTANRCALIRSCLLSPFFYLFFIYMFLFRNLELTTAGRPVRLISDHDFTLLLFYVFLYLSIFLLTYGMFFIPVIAYKLYKERQ